MNTEAGGQKYTPTRDEETKGGLRTAKQMGEDKSTYILEMKRQCGVRGQQTHVKEDKSTHKLEIKEKVGSEDSKHR